MATLLRITSRTRCLYVLQNVSDTNTDLFSRVWLLDELVCTFHRTAWQSSNLYYLCQRCGWFESQPIPHIFSVISLTDISQIKCNPLTWLHTHREEVELCLQSNCSPAQQVVRQHYVSASLPQGNNSGTHCTGGWVGLGTGLDGTGIVFPTGIWSPDHPARSDLLYRLSYCGCHQPHG
jgi:hypothetical protein